jgi:hypothetical protein
MPIRKTTLEEQARQVRADFDSFENALASRNPGLLDVVKVYGGYEAAIQQAEKYLAATNLHPRFCTTNGTGSVL